MRHASGLPTRLMNGSAPVSAQCPEPAPGRAPTPDSRTAKRVTSRHLWDRVAALLVLALAVHLLVVSARYGFFQGDRPGPGLFPAIMATLLLLASAGWLITGAGHPAAGAGHEASAVKLAEAAGVHPGAPGVPDVARGLDDPHEEEPIDGAGVRRIAFVVAWTVVPLLLLEPLGYVLTMTVYLAGLLALLARVRPWVAVAGALAGSAVTGRGADALGIVLPDPLGLLQLLGA